VTSAHVTDRDSRHASIVLALTLPGDTVLYLLLPLYPQVFGVTLAQAGLLLAANRLIRIVGYGWVARGYAHYGARTTCTWATAGSVGAAIAYATVSGVWWMLVARLVWGLSFATFNIATQDLATRAHEGAARRSGRSRGIIACGPMVGLLAGAALAQTQGPRLVFAALAIVAALALPFARRLPGPSDEVTIAQRPRLALPSRLDVWSFVQGLTLDGIFVLGLAVLAAAALPHDAAMAAGAVLALRYGAEIVLGPPGGALAGRWGALPLLVSLSVASAGGLAAMGLGWPWAGAIAIVLLRGLLQPLPAPVASALNPGPERVSALARLATWRDLGAGVGPLIAGVLLVRLTPAVLYGTASVALVASAIALVATRRSNNR
jgi:predicted MFS family arabinose efflux permease